MELFQPGQAPGIEGFKAITQFFGVVIADAQHNPCAGLCHDGAGYLGIAL